MTVLAAGLPAAQQPPQPRRSTVVGDAVTMLRRNLLHLPPSRAMLPHPPDGSTAAPPPARPGAARPPHRALPGFRTAGAITLLWLGPPIPKGE